MHELLVRRFEGRRWEHVLFHGGLSSPKRKDMIDRFRDDPNCRVFLSTDSGGVGLNLQHASVVLNMDLPWNPAVLEQRIGRVHRLGQRQPVRVVNFVSQGTIEEGMLGVLKFKKSLFAGVLDSGEKEVFLGGSRLNKFMETVESATSAIPEAMIEDAEESLRTPPGRTSGGRTRRRSARPAARRPTAAGGGDGARGGSDTDRGATGGRSVGGIVSDRHGVVATTGHRKQQRFLADRPVMVSPRRARWCSATSKPARRISSCRCLRRKWSTRHYKRSAHYCRVFASDSTETIHQRRRSDGRGRDGKTRPAASAGSPPVDRGRKVPPAHLPIRIVNEWKRS